MPPRQLQPAAHSLLAGYLLLRISLHERLRRNIPAPLVRALAAKNVPRGAELEERPEDFAREVTVVCVSKTRSLFCVLLFLLFFFTPTQTPQFCKCRLKIKSTLVDVGWQLLGKTTATMPQN